ncbi:MAG: CDP-alcohol phosphatidyltransferase family protein [Tannerella sp.]|jgi:hypothetical protein|nr:CDP-alcohol phosphatidyltransferase family protein [Tannerella sp.]
MKEKRQMDMTSTLKSQDTEEFIDLHFYRPMGYRWALLFARLGVHPNTVTIASMFIGIAAGVCFSFTNIWINIVGMALLVWANTYDSADGQLARMTKRTSAFGRILDGFCGDVWFVAIYAAICFRLMPEWGWWIWLLAAVTGFCHSQQAAMADYYRNAHLFFLKGEQGSELSDSQALYEDFKRKKDESFIARMSAYIYYNYTKGQEARAKQFVRLMRVLRRLYPAAISDTFRAAFRAKSLPLMKYANMLSFNTRVIALFISLLINIPWLYFVFELTVLNVMFIYMISTHEHFSRQFAYELENTTND